MALKFKINSKAEVPAEQAALYSERDGAFFLDVEGAVEKAKLDEFRSNNISLTKERDELKQRFDGIDPDAMRALAAERQKLEEAAQLKAGEVEKVFESRTKALKGDFDKQLSAVTSERDALNARLLAIQIDQGVITVASKRGLRASAAGGAAVRGSNRNPFRRESWNLTEQMKIQKTDRQLAARLRAAA